MKEGWKEGFLGFVSSASLLGPHMLFGKQHNTYIIDTKKVSLAVKDIYL